MAATHPRSQLKGKQPKVAQPKAPARPKKAQAKQSWKRPAAPAVEGVAIGAAALIPVELLYGVAIGQVSQTVVPDAAGLKVFGIVAGSCTAGRTTVALEKGLTVELPNGELAPCIRVKDAELHGRYGKFVAFEPDVANVLERPAGAPAQQPNSSKRRRLPKPVTVAGDQYVCLVPPYFLSTYTNRMDAADLTRPQDPDGPRIVAFARPLPDGTHAEMQYRDKTALVPMAAAVTWAVTDADEAAELTKQYLGQLVARTEDMPARAAAPAGGQTPARVAPSTMLVHGSPPVSGLAPSTPRANASVSGAGLARAPSPATPTCGGHAANASAAASRTDGLGSAGRQSFAAAHGSMQDLHVTTASLGERRDGAGRVAGILPSWTGRECVVEERGGGLVRAFSTGAVKRASTSGLLRAASSPLLSCVLPASGPLFSPTASPSGARTGAEQRGSPQQATLMSPTTSSGPLSTGFVAQRLSRTPTAPYLDGGGSPSTAWVGQPRMSPENSEPQHELGGFDNDADVSWRAGSGSSSADSQGASAAASHLTDGGAAGSDGSTAAGTMPDWLAKRPRSRKPRGAAKRSSANAACFESIASGNQAAYDRLCRAIYDANKKKKPKAREEEQEGSMLEAEQDSNAKGGKGAVTPAETAIADAYKKVMRQLCAQALPAMRRADTGTPESHAALHSCAPTLTSHICRRHSEASRSATRLIKLASRRCRRQRGAFQCSIWRRIGCEPPAPAVPEARAVKSIQENLQRLYAYESRGAYERGCESRGWRGRSSARHCRERIVRYRPWVDGRVTARIPPVTPDTQRLRCPV